MFRLDVIAGSADVSVPIMVIDSSDGTPETGYDHTTSGIDLWYRREGGAEVSITEAALAAWNSAHSDGGVEHGSDGRGRLDLPDAACAVGSDGATYVEYGGTITGMIVIGGVIQLVDPVAGLFKSHAIDSSGNTTTNLRVPDFAAYANDELNNELLWVLDVSADEWHPCWVTDFDTTNGDVTVQTAAGGGALPFTPEASVDRVWRSGLNRNNIGASGTVSADVVSVSGDGTAADNLEAAYDGTGYDVGGIDVSVLNTAATAVGSDGSALTEAGGTGDHLTAVLSTAITESYGTDGSALTAGQLLYLIYGLVGEFAVSGTTMTVKKLDGSTTAATFTLDDGTSPTSITRAT